MAVTPNNALPLMPEGVLDPSPSFNLALNMIDALLQTAVLSVGSNSPPGDPEDGERHIVGSAPTGDWSALAPHAMARYVEDGDYWEEYEAGVSVHLVINLDDGKLYAFDASSSPPEWYDIVNRGLNVEAQDVDYNNATSGLAATQVQEAIDELAGDVDDRAMDRAEVTALSISSGDVAMDLSAGDYFTLALNANVTGWTLNNLPGSGRGATVMVHITQDATPRTVAWPASFKWAGGSAGSVSTGSGEVDVLAMTTFDNGTSWQVTLAKGMS